MVVETTNDTIATTNLQAYKRNLLNIRSFIGHSVRLMAVVKADAYGHGLVECARTALKAGAAMLGAAFASEGAALRAAGITAPIHVLAQETYERTPDLIKNDLTISLTSFDMLIHLSKAAERLGKPCRVHIKVDTGMGRIGIQASQAAELVEAAFASPGVEVEGIFSHFPAADDENEEFSRNQIETFSGLLKDLERKGMRPPIAHMCNSAGLLKYPEAHFDLVRPGIMTFGLSPFPGSERFLPMEPVLTLTSRITFIKEVPVGFAVSYGCTFVTQKPSRLATVPVGYADGYRRHLSNRGKAIVNGRMVPVVGTVCMDQTVFDITDAGPVKVGDPVILIGSAGGLSITADELAQITGTISHEIVTGITRRVSRTFIPAA